MTFTTRAVANLKSSLRVVAKKRTKRSAKVNMPKTRKIGEKILKAVEKVKTDIDRLLRPGMGHNLFFYFLFHYVDALGKVEGQVKKMCL